MHIFTWSSSFYYDTHTPNYAWMSQFRYCIILLKKKKGKRKKLQYSLREGFPGRSPGKESTCNAEDLGLIPGLGRSPGGERGTPLQCSCLGNPHGQRGLGGCSPRGHGESDTTERLSTARRSVRVQLRTRGSNIFLNNFQLALILASLADYF